MENHPYDWPLCVVGNVLYCVASLKLWWSLLLIFLLEHWRVSLLVFYLAHFEFDFIISESEIRLLAVFKFKFTILDL